MTEHFQGKYLTKQGKDRFGTRELAKSEVLKLLYFDTRNPHSPSQKPYEEFRRLFPDVAGYIDKLKQRDYTDFPVLLQKLEAHLMLHKVGRRIYDQHPNAWFTTIHDAIVTTTEHASLVQDVIHSTYQEILGAPPRVGRTDFTPAAARRELTEYVQRKLDQNFGTSDPEAVLDDYARLLNLLDAPLTSPTVPDVGVVLDYSFAHMPEVPELQNPFAEPKRRLKR
jgi:hypothetical protein